MGASDFTNVARRKSVHRGKNTETYSGGMKVLTPVREDFKDANEAFEHLAEEDRYENGHSYSGSIGMKRGQEHIAFAKTLEEAHRIAEDILDKNEHRVCDKWHSNAGCITITDDEQAQFLFFGVASS